MPGPKIVRTAGAAALVAGALAVGGCSAPAYRFEASASDDVVVKVPRSWTLVRSGQPATSDGSTPTPGSWLAVFDGDSRPSISHAQANTAAQPIGIVLTFVVTKDQGKQLTLDDLRDAAGPVSAAGRSQAILSGQSVPAVTLVSDQEWSTKTAHGVHVVYRYKLTTGEETFDKVAVTDASKTRVHVFLVHCTTSCFEAHRGEIATAVGSFTVRAS
jgi:hypothetical protein